MDDPSSSLTQNRFCLWFWPFAANRFTTGLYMTVTIPNVIQGSFIRESSSTTLETLSLRSSGRDFMVKFFKRAVWMLIQYWLKLKMYRKHKLCLERGSPIYFLEHILERKRALDQSSSIFQVFWIFLNEKQFQDGRIDII